MSFPIIRQSERVAAVGRTGSGKTEWLQRAMKAQRHVIAVDTKLDDGWQLDANGCGYPLYGDKVYTVGPGRFVWHTPEDWMLNDEEMQRFFDHCYRVRKSGIILLDETNDIAPSANVFPKAFHRCVTRGRSRHLGVWCGMQRPFGVPRWVFTEADHKVCFYLEDEEDQNRMQWAFGSDHPINWDALRRNEFSYFYTNKKGDVFDYKILELPEAA